MIYRVQNRAHCKCALWFAQNKNAADWLPRETLHNIACTYYSSPLVMENQLSGGTLWKLR
jgi:hypothetical protein